MSPTYSVCQVHGYLEGEQYKCPICGRKAEVYSRITGYYRPVQNWNDGKSEEFKNRLVYNPETSVLTKTNKVVEEQEQEAVAVAKDILLFGTKTCPNCKTAKIILEKASVPYIFVDADENKEVTNAYGVKKAPTLLVPSENGYEKYDNISLIKKYAESIIK